MLFNFDNLAESGKTASQKIKDKRMPVDVKLLESLELFADLGNGALTKFASRMNRLKVMEGEELIRMENVASALFVVLKGNFMIYFKNNRAITIHKRGETLNWSAAAPFKCAGAALALTKGEVLSLEEADFSTIVRQGSDAGDKLMKRLDKTIAKRSAVLIAPSKNSKMRRF